MLRYRILLLKLLHRRCITPAAWLGLSSFLLNFVQLCLTWFLWLLWLLWWSKKASLHISFKLSLFPDWNSLQVECKIFIVFARAKLILAVLHYSNYTLLLLWSQFTNTIYEILFFSFIHRFITRFLWNKRFNVFSRDQSTCDSLLGCLLLLHWFMLLPLLFHNFFCHLVTLYHLKGLDLLDLMLCQILVCLPK